MAEKIDLRQIERNLFRDYCQDGLADTAFGAYFLLIGLLLPVGALAPFVVFAAAFFVPVVLALKKRFTYPRTGYVELRQSDLQPLPLFIFGSLVLGLVALVTTLIATGVIAQPDQWYRWMPILFGTWLAGVFLGLAVRVGLPRYYVVAVVALGSGPTCALLPLTGKLANIGLFFTVVGVVQLAWGAATFVRFLSRHPLPTEGVDDAAN